MHPKKKVALIYLCLLLILLGVGVNKAYIKTRIWITEEWYDREDVIDNYVSKAYREKRVLSDYRDKIEEKIITNQRWLWRGGHDYYEDWAQTGITDSLLEYYDSKICREKGRWLDVRSREPYKAECRGY